MTISDPPSIVVNCPRCRRIKWAHAPCPSCGTRPTSPAPRPAPRENPTPAAEVAARFLEDPH